MNTYRFFFATLCFGISTLIAQAQGTFQNLDFESANIPQSTTSGSLVPVSEAIPDWSASFTSGATILPETQIFYDGISTGGAVISLVDAGGATPIQGNYSMFLFAGGNAPGVGGVDSASYSPTISQTGTIPTGTESLFMDVGTHSALPTVWFNGQAVDMTPMQSFVHYTLFGGNISSFAGDNGTLSITEPLGPAGGFADAQIDNISFSTSVVPEPSPLTLVGIAGILFALYRRFAPKRQ